MTKNTIHGLFKNVLFKLLQKHNDNNYFIFSNSITGTHGSGNATYPIAQKIEEPYIFVKFSENGISVETAASSKYETDKENGSRAIGVATDQSDKIEDPVNVQLLGAHTGTCRVRAAEKIKSGDLIVSNPSGKACSLSSQEKGHYYVYGISITHAEKGSLVEFIATPGLEKIKN